MSFSTGNNYNKIVAFLQGEQDAQLTSKFPSQYKRKDLPDEILEKLTKCDIPHIEYTIGEFTIYFSCCTHEDLVLTLSVITKYPDLIEKQIYDLLLPKKSYQYVL